MIGFSHRLRVFSLASDPCVIKHSVVCKWLKRCEK
uniref:Uncharacterized protein n=1 Tax=Anopheles quadriannulatus TaxID=34691 RepID=A0A182XSG9_ANOQN